MHVQQVVQLLDGVKKHGEGYMARCPAHDDYIPSLSINTGKDGRVLIKCFAGCVLDDVLSVIGLQRQDLYPGNDRARPKRKSVQPTAIYNYTNKNGDILYRKKRFGHGEGKAFSQERPDGKGGWINNIKGVERVLYNLPAVLAADNVWVVEGEMDADTLNSAGFVATTATEGAGVKWRKEYYEALRGKNVVVIPDNDDKGRQHAFSIVSGLNGIAESIKLYDLTAGDEPPYPNMPEKGDVTDLFNSYMQQDASNGKELAAWLLRKYVDKVPTYMAAKAPRKEGIKAISAVELHDKEYPELFQPVEQFICEGLTIIAGASKIGKSWIALLLAASVAQGIPFWGRDTSKCRVLYFALEDSERRLQDRLHTLGIDEPPENLYLATKADMMGAGFEEQLCDWLSGSKEPALVIIDTFQKIRGMSPKGANAYQSDYVAVSMLKGIADRHRAAIVGIHHTNKGQGHADPFDRISGSTGIMGAADTAILISRDRDKDIAEVMFTGRDVYGDDFVIKLTNGRWDIENNNAKNYRLEIEYEQEPLVKTFRKIIAEYPDGDRWSYDRLRKYGYDYLRYYPFLDARDFTIKLNSGLGEELRKRDGIIVETKVKVGGNRGLLFRKAIPETGYQVDFGNYP